MLPRDLALRCLARTACINAAVTARGMQQIGLSFVLAPAFAWLYPDPAARARAFGRYSGHSNTHVFMVPLYVGIILALEQQIARGTLPEDAATAVRETLATTLSALGDSLFSGSLLPCWALCSVFLILAGYVGAAALLSLLTLLGLLVFRVWSFFAGLRNGLSVLNTLRQCNPITWGSHLKLFNAFLVVLVVWFLPFEQWQPFPWAVFALSIAAILGSAWLVGRMHLPRILLWALVLGVLIVMDVGLFAM